MQLATRCWISGIGAVLYPRGMRPVKERVAGHAVRGPFNSWILARIDGMMDRVYGDRKRRMFRSLPSAIVELGPGAGANFQYYSRGTSVTAIEPNPYMHRRLREAAERHDIRLDIRGGSAEEIDLETESTGVVVGTLVLCTVTNPERVIAEVWRILCPGGQFLFIEHVAAMPGTMLRRAQEIVRRPWRWCFEGCNTQRETWRLLEAAGFSTLELERFSLNPSFIPVAPQIAGVGTK